MLTLFLDLLNGGPINKTHNEHILYISGDTYRQTTQAEPRGKLAEEPWELIVRFVVCMNSAKSYTNLLRYIACYRHSA